MRASRAPLGALFWSSCAGLLVPTPGLQARTRRRVLAEPEHEVELAHSIEALLQPGGAATSSGLETLFAAPVELFEELEET